MENTEQVPAKRGPGRPRLNRDEDGVREPVRAESIRGRQRMRKGGGMKDRFAIPDHLKDPRTSYEWKTASVLGQPQTSHMVEMREQGWMPVTDRSIIDYFMPEGHQGAPERDGLILMDRPIELTEEARAEEEALASLAVWTKEQQLGAAGPGQFERSNKGNPLASVRRSVERGEIPVD